MKLRCIKLRMALMALLFVCSPIGQAQSLSSPDLTFGVVPQQAVEKLARQWIPFLKLLSEQTGLRIEFSTAPSIPEFEKRLAQGEYDVAYMNPYHFTVFNKAPGYLALVRQRDHVIRGIIVVSADLNVETLEDLAGRNLSFPAPRAFAATLITRAFLDTAAPGYTATFVNSHDSVYRTVAEGLFAGGGGIIRTLKEVDPDIQRKLEILWMSPGYTGHAFAAHPRISQEVRLKLQEAMVALDATDDGQAMLETLGMNGFQIAKDSDWDDVRALGIN